MGRVLVRADFTADQYSHYMSHGASSVDTAGERPASACFSNSDFYAETMGEQYRILNERRGLDVRNRSF